MKNKITITFLLFWLNFPIGITQNAVPVSARCIENSPTLKWFIGEKDQYQNQKEQLILMRSEINKASFNRVATFCTLFPRQDSMFVICIDSSITTEGFYEYQLAGKVGEIPIQSKGNLLAHSYTYLPNPRVYSFEAQQIPDKKAIALAWKINFHESIRSIDLYRKGPFEENFRFLTALNPRQRKYEDVVTVANESYTYQLVVNDFFGGHFKSIFIHGLTKYKAPAYPPQDFHVQKGRNGVQLSWRRLGNNVLGYNIYRKLGNNGSFRLITDRIDTNDSLIYYLDRDTVLAKHAIVAYKVHAISDGFLESISSDTLQIQNEISIEVASPNELVIVQDSGKYLGLIWENQLEDENILGYKITAIKNDRSEKDLGSVSSELNFIAIENDHYKSISIQSLGPGNFISKKKTKIVNENQDPSGLDFQIVQVEEMVLITWPKMDANFALDIYKSINFQKPQHLTSIKSADQKYIDRNVENGTTIQYYIMEKNNPDGNLLYDGSILINH